MPPGDRADPTGPEDATPPGAQTFDPVWYLQAYPDVREAGLDPWQHYATRGRAEGRLGAPVLSLDLDHLLWRGHAAMALPALEALLTGDDPRDAALAGWALARWYLDCGDIAAARRAIAAFHSHPEGAQALNHPGPFLLAAQLCLQANEVEAARAHLRAGSRRFGLLPDFLLGEFLCRKAQGAPVRELNDLFAGLYLAQGLLPVEILDLPGVLFDRLGVDPGPVRPDEGQDLPLVSVIVPVRNGGAVLDTALRGLRAQSWRNLEIIVVDDGSTDDTAAVAARHAARDPRLRVVRRTRSQGAYPARNLGLSRAQGDFITVHDADDWSHPSKIALQVAPLRADPALKATVSHWVRAGPDLDMTRWRIEDRWVHRNVSSLMLRAELRDDLGYWDRVRVNADTEYYYRIIAAYGPAAIHEVQPGLPLAFGRTDLASLTMRDATHARTQLKGVRRDYMEAAQHWHATARAAGPKALFLTQHPAVRPFRVPPALTLGDPDPPETPFDILSASALFDSDWYGLGHPDVLRLDLNPVRHYLASGGRENRDPGPGFSSGGYRQAMGLPPEDNPLLHYETVGRGMGAAPLPRFAGALAARLANRDACKLVFAHAAGKALFGAERSLLDMLRRMIRDGDVPVVVLPALQGADYLDQVRALSAAVEMVPQQWRHAWRAPHPDTLARLRGLIRHYAPTEVLVNTLVLEAPLIAARLEGVPSTVYVRELPAEDQALCRTLGTDAEGLRTRLLTQANRFVVASPLVADWLGAGARTRLQPNAVDPALFEVPFAPEPALRVAIVSSNIAKKGLADFLAVARLVAAEGRTVRFRIIGPATQDLHLLRPWPDNVEFAGYAETPVEAMRQADVVMSLSKFTESFGRTVMEAMAAGRPVVCYDRGAPPSLVDSGTSGFVVPADDPAAAARAILALDAARRQLLVFSAAARLRAMELQRQALRA